MKPLNTIFSSVTITAVVLALSMAPTDNANAQDDAEDSLVQIVRQTASRFRDVNVALAEGYIPDLGCISAPGAGAMGQHYMKPSLVDGIVDATQPEMLVYEPTEDGGLRLVAADYLVPFAPWHASHARAPSLEDQTFFLIPSENRYAPAAAYTLHVWAFKYNPNGAFAMWNPNVSCAPEYPEGAFMSDDLSELAPLRDDRRACHPLRRSCPAR